VASGRVIFIDGDRGRLDEVRAEIEPWAARWHASFLTTPEGALEALATAPGAVVVSLSEVPRVGGVTLCDRARDLGRGEGAGYCYCIRVAEEQDVDEAVAAVGEHLDDFIRAPFDVRELATRVMLGLRVIEVERSLRESNHQLSHMRHLDPLTGLLSRRRGAERIADELARVGRGQQDLTVLLLEVDHLDELSASLGAAVADGVQREVATRLVATCRSYDFAVRWHEETFLLVFPHSGTAEARAIGRRLLQVVAGNAVAAGPDPYLTVTASAGVATAIKGARVTLEDLTSAAERALEGAHDQAPGTVCYAKDAAEQAG